MSLDTALERPPSLFALFHAAGNCRQSRTKGSSSKLGKGLHRAHRAPTCDRGPRAAKMGAPHGARLAVRPLHRLFRNHVVFLLRLASALPCRGNLYGPRGTAGRSAGFYTGSVGLSSGYILRRRRGAGGGSSCSTLHTSVVFRFPSWQ
jgi:hypothetical protein